MIDYIRTNGKIQSDTLDKTKAMRYTVRSDRGVIGADLRRSRVNILIYIWSCYGEDFASLIDETYLRKGRRWVFFLFPAPKKTEESIWV